MLQKWYFIIVSLRHHISTIIVAKNQNNVVPKITSL